MAPAETAADKRATALFRAQRERDPGPLLELLTDPDLRTLAAYSLGDLGEARAIPGLIRLLDASDPHARTAGAKTLGKLKAAEAADRLIEIAEVDPAPNVRSHATHAVARIAAAGKLNGRDIVPLLISFLDDHQLEVKLGAAVSLNLLPDRRALQPLRLARKRDLWHRHGFLLWRRYTKAIGAIRRETPSN